MSLIPALEVLDHPLARRDLTILRDKTSAAEAFRSATHRLARILALASLHDLATDSVAVQTPLQATTGVKLCQRVAVVPVLRAGLGFVAGFLEVLPEAQVCHLGIVRDEATLQPQVYLDRLHNLQAESLVVLLDPMLATGGSALAALAAIARRGCRNVRLACLIAAPEGVAAVRQAHPSIRIFTAAVDDGLDERGFIRPGLGDAGDRLFDT